MLILNWKKKTGRAKLDNLPPQKILFQDIEQTLTVLFQKKQGGMGDWPTFTSSLLRNIMTAHTWYIS